MKSARLAKALSYLGAGVLVLCSIYCLLWLMASSSLACEACNCSYSLFAENPRCRQPPIAGLLALANFIGAGALILWGRVRRTANPSQGGENAD
jgi:hypothetical protein